MESTEELEAVGEDFYVSLSELTFNSKPIISTLTMIAQENINAAPYIAQAVEKRIDKAIPAHKLFAIYLLDSICKNVGSPYTLLFGQKLSQTFSRTYLLVDDATRKKLIDLFKTWKIATTSTGLPLFPEEPISKIEQFLIKASSLHQQAQPMQPPPQQQYLHTQDSVSPQMLFPTLDRLLYLTNQRLNQNPHDTRISEKISIIEKLQQAIQTQYLPPQVLLGAKNQLDEMTRQEEEYLRNTPSIKSPQLAQPIPNLRNLLQTVHAPSPPVATVPVQAPVVVPPQPAPVAAPAPIPTNPLGMNSLSSLLKLKSPSIKSPSPPAQSESQSQPNISSILSSLAKSGVVKSQIPQTSLLSSILSKAKPQTRTPTTQAQVQSQLKTELDQYDIAGKFLTLDPSATYTALLITSKPNKCGTCGKRFSNDLEGQIKSRKHLDWHFRVNKRLRDGQGAMSRNWFLDDVEFVEFRDEDVIGTGIDGDDVQDKKKVKETKERKFVVVPADSEDMKCVCGVCKEVLKAVYDDDSGEWIWDDAVMKNGKVFHQSCYEETHKGLSAVLSSLKRPRDEKVDFNKLKNIVKNVKLDDDPKMKAEIS